MPKREPVLKSVKKSDPLLLSCEWEACNVTFSEMKSFMDHISDHLQLLLNFMNGEKTKGTVDRPNSDSQFACYWNECSHEPFSEFTSLVRHVYFHAFHMKIKSIGMSLIVKNSMQGCLFDSSTRNTIPDIPERFSCGWSHCSTVYDNPELFYLHINNHCDVYPSGNHVPGGCRCQWEGCDTIVKSKHKLKDHVRAHTQEKLAACPTCGALFSNMTRLYDHLKRQLESEGESYQCSHCNKRYATERLLKEHMRHHVSHFQCPFCDMTCPNLVNLRLHFQYRHSESRPYKCDQCSHAAKSQNDLRRHLETHKLWIHCDLEDCSFRCHSVNELKRHNKLKHEYTEGVGQHQFQCHLCHACYRLGTKLTCHLRKKHKFRWPPGHVRFRYKFHSDGYYRLQTVRYESIELTQQILASDITGAEDVEPASSGDHGQTEVIQSNSTSRDQPADVYDEVMIKDGEASKEADVIYSYNLDLLGDVALKDSARCENEPVSSSVLEEVASTENAKTSPVVAEDHIETKRKKGKRKRVLTASEEDMALSSSNVTQKRAKMKGNESYGQQLKLQSHSVLVKDVKDVSQVISDVKDYKPVTEQTISLPDGQQIILTSDVPVDISVEPQTIPLDKMASIEQTQAMFEGIVSPESMSSSQYHTSQGDKISGSTLLDVIRDDSHILGSNGPDSNSLVVTDTSESEQHDIPQTDEGTNLSSVQEDDDDVFTRTKSDLPISEDLHDGVSETDQISD